MRSIDNSYVKRIRQISLVFQRTVIADFHTNIKSPPFIRAICARLRGSGDCWQDRLEQLYAEKCLLEFSVSGAKWADDIQISQGNLGIPDQAKTTEIH